jgi:hypothetical protein
VKPDELLATILDADDLACVDACAQDWGVTRVRMLIMLVRSGISLLCERENAPPESHARPKGGAS